MEKTILVDICHFWSPQVTLKKSSKVEKEPTIESGPFVLNLKSRTVAKNGVPVELTQVEYQILEYFMNNQISVIVNFLDYL